MSPKLARSIFVLIAECEFDLWERRAQAAREAQTQREAQPADDDANEQSE